MLLRSPGEAEFESIFKSFCALKELPCPEHLLSQFVAKHYRNTGKAYRRCHPRDLISHVIDLIHFESMPYELTEDVLDRAFEGCFLQENES